MKNGSKRARQKHDYDRVFGFVVAYKQEHDGLAPSHREIMEACEIPSTSTVAYILDVLQAAGRIRVGERGQRVIQVVGGKWSMAA